MKGIFPLVLILSAMDDRRDLAIPSISLRNNAPDAFEGLRHYGPQKIVDAMAAILNQITCHNFRNIENAGSEQERKATVNGWRIYLHHWKKDTHNQATEDTSKRSKEAEQGVDGKPPSATQPPR